MKIQINRKHAIEVDQIEKIVIKKNRDMPWVYLKKGNFPPILICRDGLQTLKNRMVNALHTIHEFKVEKE